MEWGVGCKDNPTFSSVVSRDSQTLPRIDGLDFLRSFPTKDVDLLL